ncbi:putative interleukin-17 receptor E-like [Tachyglossus aculeatus]|uniref:putative interleukin-17 receptor E-like n=1 Tax=Tachyglossus aculeatus TaxID=9261 RepID=UPI0018F57BCF|nr:putative interleukin-17 receptor E-like [Tachyglossus aculeatus]
METTAKFLDLVWTTTTGKKVDSGPKPLETCKHGTHVTPSRAPQAAFGERFQNRGTFCPGAQAESCETALPVLLFPPAGYVPPQSPQPRTPVLPPDIVTSQCWSLLFPVASWNKLPELPPLAGPQPQLWPWLADGAFPQNLSLFLSPDTPSPSSRLEGVSCRSAPTTDISNSFCREPPASFPLALLKSLVGAPVLRCPPGGFCSLNLRVRANITLTELIKGVEVCTLALDTQHSDCVSIWFPPGLGRHLDGRTLQVQSSCLDAGVGQQLHVTLTTIPNFCRVELTQLLQVPDCENEDLEKNIPLCFVGTLEWEVDRVRRNITVRLVQLPEGQDYHVRLCRKRFSCEEEGRPALVRWKEKEKTVSLPYSRLLPCLCIEGWSAVLDARRLQICPFKNETDALWDAVWFNPLTQGLVWEPPCPIQAQIHLCQGSESGDQCAELPKSAQTAQGKVMYSRVDPHPRLCIKFTTQQGSWVRCPFENSILTAWKMGLVVRAGKVHVAFSSSHRARFEAQLCNRTQPLACQPIQKFPPVSMLLLPLVRQLGQHLESESH